MAVSRLVQRIGTGQLSRVSEYSWKLGVSSNGATRDQLMDGTFKLQVSSPPKHLLHRPDAIDPSPGNVLDGCCDSWMGSVLDENVRNSWLVARSSEAQTGQSNADGWRDPLSRASSTLTRASCYLQGGIRQTGFSARERLRTAKSWALEASIREADARDQAVIVAQVAEEAAVAEEEARVAAEEDAAASAGALHRFGCSTKAVTTANMLKTEGDQAGDACEAAAKDVVTATAAKAVALSVGEADRAIQMALARQNCAGTAEQVATLRLLFPCDCVTVVSSGNVWLYSSV